MTRKTGRIEVGNAIWLSRSKLETLLLPVSLELRTQK